jgi:voltage-gated sodium channel
MDPTSSMRENPDGEISGRATRAMHTFDYFMAGVVITNVLQVGIELQFPARHCIWFLCNVIFAICYVVEMAVKLLNYGTGYFTLKPEGDKNWAKWNILDFSLTILALLQVSYSVSPLEGSERLWCGACIPRLNAHHHLSAHHKLLGLMRMLRFARVIRLIKVMKNIPELVMVIDGVRNAMKSLSWVLVLQAIFVYSFAVFFCITIGEDEELGEHFVGPLAYFGTLANSLLTMMSIAIIAEWDKIVRPVYHQKPIFLVFFAFFLMATAFGMMNVMIGIIVDSTQLARKDLETENNHKRMAEAEEMWKQMIHNAHLRTEEIADTSDEHEREVMSRKRLELIKDILQTIIDREVINVPLGLTPDDLINLLDFDGSGDLSSTEFRAGMERLLFGDHFQHTCLTMTLIGKFRKESADQRQELKDRLLRREEKLDLVLQKLNHL